MEKDKEKLIHKKKPIRMTLSRGFRILLFFVLVSVEFAINISSGLLSSASKNIKKTLVMKDAEFGLFGTFNGLGLVIGSSIFIIIVNYFNRKWVFALFVLVKSFLLCCFKLTTQKYLLIVFYSVLFFILYYNCLFLLKKIITVIRILSFQQCPSTKQLFSFLRLN